MRLMMLIGTEPNSLGSCLARGLNDSNCHLQLLDVPTGRPTLYERATRRLIPWCGFNDFNKILFAEVAARRPDVLWIFKGMEVYKSTLRALRQQGIILVNYNADHPFNHFSRGSGNANVRGCIPEYDLHLTYSRRIARELIDYDNRLRVAVVPFGHDVSDTLYERISSEDEVLRACFLGNPDSHRASNIKTLLRAGVPVDVYGHCWSQFLNPSPLLRLHNAVLGEDMLRVLRRYRVQLNFFRPHNAESHNMRSFEVPACGGIMLAEDSVEHRAFFESDREAFYFRSPEEMINSARSILAISANEAKVIRFAARRRSVMSDYSYRNRAHVAFSEIEKVKKAR